MGAASGPRVIPMMYQHSLPTRLDVGSGTVMGSNCSSTTDLPSPLFAAPSPLPLAPRLGVGGFSRSGYRAVPSAVKSENGRGGGNVEEDDEDAEEGVQEKGVVHDDVHINIPENSPESFGGTAFFSGTLRWECPGGRNGRKKTNRGALSKEGMSHLNGKVFTWGDDFSLNMEDVAAVTWGQGELKFTLHAFPSKSPRWLARPKRRRLDLEFSVPTPEQARCWMAGFAEANCRVILPVSAMADNGHENLDPVAGNIDAGKTRTSTAQMMAVHNQLGAKVLVIVNPKSGHGKAAKVFQSQVLPIFELAGLRYSILETGCPKHAERLAAAADLSACPDGIVCVGGDGIVNEVLNGLFSRKDAAQAMEVPIGIIPAGSDNSLCWSVLGIRDPISAALSIIKGGSVAMDAFAVRWGTGMFQLGLCTAYYGFMSDVLELSACYHRTFGPLRYAVAGMYRMLRLPAYDVVVEFLPMDDGEDTKSDGLECIPNNGGGLDEPAMKTPGEESGSVKTEEEASRMGMAVQTGGSFVPEQNGVKDGGGWREEADGFAQGLSAHGMAGTVSAGSGGRGVLGGGGALGAADVVVDIGAMGPPMIPVIVEGRACPTAGEGMENRGESDSSPGGLVEDSCNPANGRAVLEDVKGMQGEGFKRFVWGSKLRKSSSACNLFSEKSSGLAVQPSKSRRCSSEKFSPLPSDECVAEVMAMPSCSPSCSPKRRSRGAVSAKGRTSVDGGGGVAGSKLGHGWVLMDDNVITEDGEKGQEKRMKKHGGTCFPVGLAMGLKSWKRGSKLSKGQESSRKGEGKGNGKDMHKSGPVPKVAQDEETQKNGKWVQRQGPFLCVIACNHRCKSVQCFDSQCLAPNAAADDGGLDLVLVRAVGRLQLLRFLFMMQFGRHITLPYVEYLKTRAVRLIPGNNVHRACGIDGELLPLEEPIVTAILPSQCRLIGRPPSPH